jgi:hypothetical protein
MTMRSEPRNRYQKTLMFLRDRTFFTSEYPPEGIRSPWESDSGSAGSIRIALRFLRSGPGTFGG